MSAMDVAAGHAREGRALDGMIRDSARAFTSAGIETAMLDARVLVAHVLGVDAATLILEGERTLTRREVAEINSLIRRRARREPIGRIIGKRAFWRDEFALNAATLEPRPDSEAVVEAALACAALLAESAGGARALSVVDLGTGSGCLLISVLRELDRAYGIGVDLAARALDAARVNARTAGVADRAGFICADWGAPLQGRFDIVVSNPPYIRSGEIEDLKPEVSRHDPALALDGGADGLEAYRVIAAQAGRLLASGGWLVVEIGDGQKDAVGDILLTHGLVWRDDERGVGRDLTGAARVLCAANKN